MKGQLNARMPGLRATRRLGTGGGSGFRFAKGARVAFAGDSIFQNGLDGAVAAASLQSNLRGELNWVRALARNINIDSWPSSDSRQSRYFTGANHGISGDNAAGLLSRVSEITAMQPDICIVAIGANDSATTAVWQAIRDTVLALQAAGILVVVGNVRAQTVNYSVVSALNALIAANVWTMPGVVPLDLFTPYWDGATGAKPGYLADTKHPNYYGAYFGALAIKAVLDTLVAPGNLLLDLWNSGTNLIPNGIFSGTAGTVGANCSGSVPTGFNFVRGSASYNSTGVMSLEANPETGGQSCVVTVTPVGTNSTEFLRLETSPAIITSGVPAALANKWVRTVQEIEFDAWPSFLSPEMNLSENPGSSNVFTASALGTYTGKMPGPLTLWLDGPPVLFDGSPTGFTMQHKFRFNPNGAIGTGTYKIKRIGLFTVPNPKTAWNS